MFSTQFGLLLVVFQVVVENVKSLPATWAEIEHMRYIDYLLKFHNLKNVAVLNIPKINVFSVSITKMTEVMVFS